MEREKIAARIRALRAKTVENGCTEDEAIAAAEMLAKLLAKYNMTLDEAELRASPFEHHTETHTDWVGDRLWKIAAAVSHLTDARYWMSPPGVHPVEVNFFGFAHEVEVARYMLEICANAMRREQTKILRRGALFTRDRKRRMVSPFLDGMADRLSQRIRALKLAMSPGTGLIVLRGELVAQAMAVAGLSTKNHQARPSRSLDPGYQDGVRAGDGVALNSGLDGPGAARALLI